MTRTGRTFAFLICTTILGAWVLRAQKYSEAHEEQSCRRFVQAFYNWYVTTAVPYARAHEEEPYYEALSYKGRSPFSPELTRLLTECVAESKAGNDPVVDDFDSILNTQDPAGRYVVRKVTRKGDRYWVDVYGVWPEPVSGLGKGPQVVAEVAFESGRWEL